MTVLVVMPVYKVPAILLHKAVQSVLNQTFTDICLLLIGDGEKPAPFNILDSRVVEFTLTQNRGRYFADAVAQAATPFEWYAPHDADDWSEIIRLDDLWDRSGAGVVWSDHINHRGQQRSRATFPRATKPLGPEQKRVACHLGLYHIDRLRATGGYHPDFRVHYDSLHNNLVKMTGPILYSPKALYHRIQWDGSLTRSASVGMRTEYRNQAARRCRRLYKHAYELYTAGKSDEIAGMIRSTILPETAEAVEHEAERLRKELG